MYSFTNGYSEGAHPKISEAMMKKNLNQQTDYGLDTHCIHAVELIKKEVGCGDVGIHFLVDGTQTNLLVTSAALRPYQAVISTHTGHINVHETGVIKTAGHKVLAMESLDGKLSPALVQKALGAHTGERMIQPELVYTSDPTKTDTQYTKAELGALRYIYHQNQLYLFMGGARIGSALTGEINDLALADIASLVDVFYIDGIKDAALFGEALIICTEVLRPDFRLVIKQRGAMLAKGWLLGIQFEEPFQNNLSFEAAAHASEMTSRLRRTLIDHGYTLASNSTTSQFFPILPDPLVEQLSKAFAFDINSKPDAIHTVIRLVTS